MASYPKSRATRNRTHAGVSGLSLTAPEPKSSIGFAITDSAGFKRYYNADGEPISAEDRFALIQANRAERVNARGPRRNALDAAARAAALVSLARAAETHERFVAPDGYVDCGGGLIMSK